MFLSKTGGVPHSHRLIQTRTDNEILAGVERCAHDVMVVARQYAQTAPLVKVPQPQRLIVAGRQYPWELSGIGMKLYRADVIQVTKQCEEASTKFVVPYFDFVVVAAGDDKRFVEVEIDSAYGAVVLFEAVDDGAYSIVPPDYHGDHER